MVMSNALQAAPEATPAVSNSNDGALILSMIDKLAARPDVPVEKLEQLFGLHQKIKAEESKRAYDAAFADMQPHLPVIEKKGKSHHGAYARWEDIVPTITPVTGKFGFGISFRVKQESGKQYITCILSHREGHREETTLELAADKSGSKNDIQAIGSSISYGKRYAAQAILNLVSSDGFEKDTDGNAAADDTPMSAAHIKVLEQLCTETDTDAKTYAQWLGEKAEQPWKSLADIPDRRFDEVRGPLALKKQAMSKKAAK